MLKRLRLKFVCINMAIVTMMLGVIFGTVIHFTHENLEQQSVQMMRALGEDMGRPSRPDAPGDQVQLPYFVLQVDRFGNLLATSGGYYDLSDEEFLRELISLAVEPEEALGVIEEYDLRFSRLTTPRGERIVFADMSAENSILSGLLRNCCLIGAASFLVFLALSILLARWAIKPVEQAWQQQRQFVADASHELKTPLTVIMTNAELLHGAECDEGLRDATTEGILTMGRQMRELVERLLELARVDNGGVKMNFAELDFSQLLEEVILPFEPLFFEQGLLLEEEIEPGLRLRGSASYLRQVPEILLDNALKYAAPNSTVRVELKKQGHSGLLRVSSAGEPIPPEELKNIFKRFYRMDRARSRNGSYGLGLAIAESIVTEHRGKIWAESGEGWNRFFVQLPLIK